MPRNELNPDPICCERGRGKEQAVTDLVDLNAASLRYDGKKSYVQDLLFSQFAADNRYVLYVWTSR